MFEFLKLDLSLNDKAPTLDPYIYDMDYHSLSRENLNYVYGKITYRLKAAGFSKEYDIKLISQYSLDISVPGIEYCIDKHCPNETVFLLTFSADKMRFITPPYEEGSYEPMTWGDWTYKIFLGDELPLLIRAPWAQAKFINVGTG